MPQIPITSALGYIGIFFLISGTFLIVAGRGIIKVEKITIEQGRQTWAFGLLLAVVGFLFLVPEINNGLKSIAPTPIGTATNIFLSPSVIPTITNTSPSKNITATTINTSMPPSITPTITIVPQFTPTPQTYIWDFNNKGDSEGWGNLSSNEIGSIEVVDGLLKVKSLGYDPFFYSRPNLKISSTFTPIIAIRMAVTANNFGAIFYFITDKDADWDQNKSVKFQVSSDGQMHTYFVDMSESTGWKGWVTQLRLDPTDTIAEIQIDYIKLQAP